MSTEPTGGPNSNRLLVRRTVKALLWAALIIVAAAGANVAGIRLLGSIAGWQQWLAAASTYFLLWRLGLYAATVCGWLWMRRRLLAREPGAQTRRRLVRAEVAGALALAALEASLLMPG